MISKSNSAITRRRSRGVVRYLRTYDARALNRALDARAERLEVLIYALEGEQAKLLNNLIYAVAHIATATGRPLINES